MRTGVASAGKSQAIMSTNQRHVRTNDRRETEFAGDQLEPQRHLHTGGSGASLDLVQVPATFQACSSSQIVEGEPEMLPSFGKGSHAQRFAYAEHASKPFVRHCRTDKGSAGLQTPNMAAKPRKARPDLYAPYRERSGWYLAAWRDHAGLTLEDLAAELGKSKGYVSDLETGAQRAGRPPTRFNRDLVERVAQVVGTTGGRLIDVNPFELSERMERLNATVAQLDEAGQEAMLEMAERWLGRASAA